MNNKKIQLDRYNLQGLGGGGRWHIHFWRKTLYAFYFILYALRPIWRQLSHTLPCVLLFYAHNTRVTGWIPQSLLSFVRPSGSDERLMRLVNFLPIVRGRHIAGPRNKKKKRWRKSVSGFCHLCTGWTIWFRQKPYICHDVVSNYIMQLLLQWRRSQLLITHRYGPPPQFFSNTHYTHPPAPLLY